MIKAALSVLSSFLPSLAFSYIVAACLPACICICFTMKDEFSENRKKFVPKSLNYLYLLPNNLTFIQASKILKVQSCSLKKIHCCLKKKKILLPRHCPACLIKKNTSSLSSPLPLFFYHMCYLLLIIVSMQLVNFYPFP